MDEKKSEPDKIKLKFEAIWKARDNELNAVRERSLMVWGFLMFCYGGYGVLAMRLLFPSTSEKAECPQLVNLILIFLSLICLRLSAYWVQMAKGAKAWAEIFDYMAECFQHDFLKLKNPKRKCPAVYLKDNLPAIYKSKNCAHCDGDVSHACLFSVFPVDFNNPNLKYFPDFDASCLTTRGGTYSPSKITVAVARFSLGISAFLATVHLTVLLIKSEHVKRGLDCLNVFAPNSIYAYVIEMLLILALVIWVWFKCLRIQSFRKFIFEDKGIESSGLNQIRQIRNYLMSKNAEKTK